MYTYVSDWQRGNEGKTGQRSLIQLVKSATSSKNHGLALGLRIDERLWDFSGMGEKITSFFSNQG